MNERQTPAALLHFMLPKTSDSFTSERPAQPGWTAVSRISGAIWETWPQIFITIPRSPASLSSYWFTCSLSLLCVDRTFSVFKSGQIPVKHRQLCLANTHKVQAARTTLAVVQMYLCIHQEPTSPPKASHRTAEGIYESSALQEGFQGGRGIVLRCRNPVFSDSKHSMGSGRQLTPSCAWGEVEHRPTNGNELTQKIKFFQGVRSTGPQTSELNLLGGLFLHEGLSDVSFCPCRLWRGDCHLCWMTWRAPHLCEYRGSSQGLRWQHPWSQGSTSLSGTKEQPQKVIPSLPHKLGIFCTLFASFSLLCVCLNLHEWLFSSISKEVLLLRSISEGHRTCSECPLF